VHGDTLIQLCGIRGGVNRAIELTGAERIDGIEPGKQPSARNRLPVGVIAFA